MALEIERKFLVHGDFKKFAIKSYQIAQGFLSSNPDRTVRIRIKDSSGFITVKGKSNDSGTTRFEWEKEISLDEATDLLALCEPSVINKLRYILPINNEVFFEVDEFLCDNLGLIVAEIELPSEDFIFEKPEWLGTEVTGQIKYYNSVLSKSPYCNW